MSNEPIHLVDLRAQYEIIKPEIDAAIREVLETTAFIGGRRVSEFSQEFATMIGTAHCIPVANGTDALTIAFGIRNVVDRPAALREMARVTRPSGRVAILELAEPRGGLLGPLARFHVHTLVPRVGAWLSGASEYHYLQQSIAAFPPPGEFTKLMDEAGLEVLRVEPLTFGVCHLYLAQPRKGTA